MEREPVLKSSPLPEDELDAIYNDYFDEIAKIAGDPDLSLLEELKDLLIAKISRVEDLEHLKSWRSVISEKEKIAQNEKVIKHLMDIRMEIETQIRTLGGRVVAEGEGIAEDDEIAA